VLNIYNLETSNHVNGNGNRFVIWVQGCDLACEGCWNQQTWSFEDKQLISVNDLFDKIQEHIDTLDGITFTGGEPFLQSQKLAELAGLIKEQTSLSIHVFSGFDLAEIKEESGRSKLLGYVDTLVCGRFDGNMPNNNQTLYLFNEELDNWSFNNSDVEIEIDESNNIKITGYPTNSLINEIKDADARV
jgi:anaerobic ribonucleoside-triphosphate reductase activating protein